MVVNEKERNMSESEKLALIDKEIRDLYELCIKYEFTPKEIQECAKPILDPVKAYESNRRFKRIVVVTSVLALIVALMYYKPTSDFIHACLRIFIITVVPLEKLNSYYVTECLISNPYYDPWEFTDTSCRVCENITRIERLSNVEATNVADDYMLVNKPIIITDAMTSWPSKEQFSISFLHELYEKREELKKDPCFLTSNYNVKGGQHRVLLKQSTRGKLPDWYATWDNCDIKSTKVYREYCPRPYFLPRMVEVSPHSWVLVAKNYTSDKYKMYMPNHSVMWLSQVRGETPIKLEPRESCQESCQAIEDTLKEGEIILVTSDMWDIFYKPNADTESIAVGGAGNFDM